MPAPEISLQRHEVTSRLVADARALGTMRTAIVHPCSVEAISGALEARDEGLLDPLFVGPEAKIRAVADTAGLSLAGIVIESSSRCKAGSRH